MDFSFIPQRIIEMLTLSDAKPLKDTLALYQYARQQHVAVFFVTGRKEVLAVATMKNLHNAGYNQWTGLYFKPNNYASESIIPFKMAARKQIMQQGFHIVANIGDQRSDLVGGYAEQAYKLPNPFYFIP